MHSTAKTSLRKAEERVRDTAKASSAAIVALRRAKEEEAQARLDLPKKRKAVTDARGAMLDAKAARREAFRERVRRAGLHTTFVSLTPEELELNSPSHSPTYSPISSP